MIVAFLQNKMRSGQSQPPEADEGLVEGGGGVMMNEK